MACPTLPWAQIIGMRHRLVHAYWHVSRDRVWETLTENLPPLIAEMRRVLPPEAPTDAPSF